SDNGGTVDYNWIDISWTGIPVDGLYDDNVVGPFSIGFEFPYYWYYVDHLWIGSNGYISFASGANFAHPFAPIPIRSQPNDLLAVLAGDLDFSRGNPSCYYWTNYTDRFIISWIDVGEFGYIDSTHTFQLILDANDSSITFNYGEQHGNFFDSNGEYRNVIGMEDANGEVGLQYLRNNLPASHMYHDSLAIRFHPEPDPSFQVHDVGTAAIFNDENGAKIHRYGESLIINGKITNYGTLPESDFNVICTIRDQNSTTVYIDTININETLQSTESIWLEFDTFTPADLGEYRVEVRTYLGNDEVTANNRERAELRVVEFEIGVPVDLMYDDGTADNGRAFHGPMTGIGNGFELPPYSVLINNVQFHVFSTEGGNVRVRLVADNGNGRPGVTLGSMTLYIDSTGWFTADFSSYNFEYSDRKIYAFVIREFEDSGIRFGVDESYIQPFSYRGWEYHSGFYPDSKRAYNDIMIRLNVTPLALRDLGIGMSPVFLPVIVHAGNSFIYTGKLTNYQAVSRTSEVWIKVRKPDGQLSCVIRHWWNLLIDPYTTNTYFPVTQNVGIATPGGNYKYIAYCGEYPQIIDSIYFPVSVIGQSSAKGSGDWSVNGWGDVMQDENFVPETFSLIGNNPNPFNSITSVKFKMGSPGDVELRIYNLKGQLLETINTRYAAPGTHSITWDASEYSSGIYFYKLTTNNKTLTKRMTLLK
ncbi:MAG: T9SS type A sorting domain-containing protein, partial [candidate division Zixibacteria bacterium]|nr:T9SS type A sorting domain-containing protein [candidate division Zixibacteria bacterium]